MISSFRSLLEGPGKWVVVVLLVLAFAFFGVPQLDNFRSQDALRVGDEAYSAREVEAEFSRALRQVQAQNERAVTRSEAIEAGLLEQTIEGLVTRALIGEAADALGLVATDEMVQRYLRDQDAFANPQTGEFDAQVLQLILQQNQMTPAQFREEVREDIVRGQLVEAVGTNARAPRALVDYLLLRQNEEREVRLARLPAEAAPEADEAALQSFYAENAARYRSPETRSFRALIVSEEALMEGIDVPEDEVRALYDARAAYLGEPETRSYRQAVFPDAEAAEAARERIAAGGDFAAIARELGASVTVAEDRTEGGIVDDAVAEAVFSAEAPGLQGPVQGLVGPVLAEVTQITPGTQVSFEEAREDLAAELRAEEARTLLLDTVEAVEIARDSGATLEEAAEAAGLPAPESYGPVDRDLFTPEGAIEDVPGAVARTAFTLSEGDESEAVELDQPGYAFVALDRVTPAATRPFEAVEAEVRADYAEEAQRTALTRAVAGFEERLEAGESFEAAAEAAGAEVETRTVSAADGESGLPPAFLPELFSARLGTLVTEPQPQGNEALVAMVDEIRFGSDPRAAALATSYRGQLGQELSQELVQRYLQALQAEEGVRRNEAVIQQQFSDG
ncbi:peptidylprolyl isomerase [Parvularcula oceani]|uniref:peptidylprolyl isomerase n=1 Tax=Parvularcula oceani TaxID=1247963 RepID=UPI00055B1ADC|nr:peptidylprolyl isomerase [Parvularcula oceani]